MDLSGIIFVALAVAWAVYLIPKALKHHDEMAQTRPVERFSHTMRVLARKDTRMVEESTVVERPPVVEPVETTRRPPVITRTKARAAAARRRRVLGILTFALAVVAGLAYFHYVPWLATAAPGALIVVFLVIARLSVRAQSVQRTAVPRRARAAQVLPTEHDIDPDLDTEDTMGLSHAALAAAVAEPVADEGSLWDPLPVTLPTYVSKARARRTVRTIELTQTGVTSSGHDEADSGLVRQAEAAEAAAAEATAETVAQAEQRKASGA
ncbi:MAG: hypothetical protein JWR35_3497 [Marmoricola sp.]|nr:hypothetical protein [Marmoricola sp.]